MGIPLAIHQLPLDLNGTVDGLANPNAQYPVEQGYFPLHLGSVLVFRTDNNILIRLQLKFIVKFIAGVHADFNAFERGILIFFVLLR